MQYQNAASVLPDELLKAVQKYFSGTLVYIPAIDVRTGWGEASGARAHYDMRNTEIRRLHKEGATVKDLGRRFFLSADSVKKIIRKMA